MLLLRGNLRSSYQYGGLRRNGLGTTVLPRWLSTSLLSELEARGFVQDMTRPQELKIALATKAQGIYAGVDPTAKSLHIGHLLPLMCLLHFQVQGHHIIPLIGGATGLVGDPSGRSVERQLANRKAIEENVISLSASIARFFERALSYAKSRLGNDVAHLYPPSVASNLDWYKSVNMLDFLRSVGVHARVNTMLNRESVRARLDSQQGLSYTEFTYQLLQAYDFYYLNRHHNCTIQVGGSDQWGNIIAGLELINKMPDSSEASREAFGITTPLLTTASGDKFGKSVGNAIWLDSNLTSTFDFYQYFLRVADTDVKKYLNLFTLLPREIISKIVQEHFKNPEVRSAQRTLAAEVTELVHGEDGVKKAETHSKLLFSHDYSGLRGGDLLEALEGNSRLVVLPPDEFFGDTIAKLASKYGLLSSNSAAKKLIVSRGLYLNNQPIVHVEAKFEKSHLIDECFAVVRAGKDKLLIFALQKS